MKPNESRYEIVTIPAADGDVSGLFPQGQINFTFGKYVV
jgi:hypothetical protein